MKKLKFFLFFIILGALLYSFYNINNRNYKMHRIFLINTVNHPEYIPDSKIARITSFGFKNIKADFYWLKTIQYIGSNAVGAEYKKYLAKIVNLITDLNPDFEKPYLIAMGLLPDYNPRYEKGTINEKNNNLNILQAEEIGLKGMKQFCDQKKLNIIISENNLLKVKTEKKYKNPCKSARVPFSLAYIKFFYQNDGESASKYYKIASANEDSPSGASILSAIMQGKGGSREKSIIMFLNMVDQKKLKKDEKKIYEIFNKIIVGILNGKISLNEKNIKFLNETLNKIFPIEKDDKNEILKEGTLKEFLRKAVRGINLLYIENANKKFKKDTGKNAKSARELYNKKYIKYFPIDYQQYDNYGIGYIYDEKIGTFDKKIQSYTSDYFKGFLKVKNKKEEK